MAYYSYPPTGAAAGGITEYATFADFPNPTTVSDGTFAFALDTEILYVSNGTSWVAIAGPGVALSIGTFDSGVASANGAHIDSNALIMQSASGSVPGLVNTGSQTLAGAKTFSTAPILSSLTASQALVLDGSKNVASLAYTSAPTASTIVSRDANANAYANNWVANSTSVTSAGGTTNLTPASARVQILTGTSNQTFKLPNANTFSANGATYEFNNNSTGTLTVNDSTSSLVATIPSGGYGRIILLDNGSAAGVWDKHFLIPSSGSYGTAGMTVTGTLAATSTVTGTRLISTIATGTAPLTVASTTQVANLNAATAGNFTGSLSGDVTGTQSATVLSATTNATLTTLSALTTASALVTVGSISSGTWNATTIAVNHGGTGVTSLGNLTEATSSVLTITGGTGALITSASIQVKQASTSVSGYLSSTDWNTFNGKQASGNYITALTGDVTASGPGSVAASLTATTNATLTTISTLVSVGTITTGTWSATTIAVNKGGTGLTSGTSGGILGYTASGTLASSAALTANQLIVGGGAGATPSTLAAGTANQYLKMNATPIPAWYTVPTTTVQRFLANFYFTFTVTAANATAGDTYTNNAATYTVIYTIAGGTTLVTSSTTNTALSGTTLTRSSGTGDATITESARAAYALYQTPTGVTRIEVLMIGGGSGGVGSGSGAPGSPPTAGTSSTFLTSVGGALLTATGANINTFNGNFGASVAPSVTAPAVAIISNESVYGGPFGGATSGIGIPGGFGGVGIFGGGGAPGVPSSTSGAGARSNSGAGGGGGYAIGTGVVSGQGGNAGAFVLATISLPAANYQIVVGVGGSAGGSGTSGNTGGAGGSGQVTVVEYYV